MAKKISGLTTSKPLSGSEEFEINQNQNGSLGSYSVSAGAIKTYIEKSSPVLISFKNKIINGDFDIWQRGTSQTSSGYLADRWRDLRLGSTYTVSQQSFTVGQTDVPNNPKYFHRTVVTSSVGAANYAQVFQPIESVRTFQGQAVTLSFYAKADASKNIAIEFTQNFGSGGTPSSTVQGIGVTTCALTTSWQKFIVNTTIPSISGKTLGSDDNDYLAAVFWFDAGSDFDSRTNSLGNQSGTFDIAQVQLEKGSVATEFEDRPKGVEEALCERYFLKGGCWSRQYAGGANAAGSYLTFTVTMRVAPTVTLTHKSGTNIDGSPVATAISNTGLGIYETASGAGYCGYSVDWTAEAEF